MAITAKQIAVNLDTNEKNCVLTPPPNTNDLRVVVTKSNIAI